MEITAKYLEQLSPGYVRRHGVTPEDVDKANFLRERIEACRDLLYPKPGDTVVMIGPKVRYENGYLEKANLTEHNAMSVRAFAPFVSVCDNDFPWFSASSGYRLGLREGDVMSPAGTGIRMFKAWGHDGPSEDGAFTFPAMVNVWELRSDQIY